MNRFLRGCLALAAAAPLFSVLAAAPARAADPARLRVDYRISLAGFSIGNASLDGAFTPDRYEMRLGGQLTGVAGLFSGGGRADVAAQGRISDLHMTASGFTGRGQTNSGTRTIKMALASGNATSISIDPPFEMREDRVPLEPAHKRNVIDPLSAMVAVIPARVRPEARAEAACNRSIPVFDGTMRFDVVLSYAEKRVVQKPGFTGVVAVCNARYVPVSGHRPARPAVKFMEDNREMSVWLAEVEGTRIFVPLRISVRTMLGVSLIEAESWKLVSAGQKSVSQ